MYYQNDSEYNRNSRNNNEYTRIVDTPYNMIINKRDYLRTDVVMINEIEKLTIDMSTPGNFHRLRQIKVMLATSNLLTLIDGHRTRPIIIHTNIYGYTNRSIIHINPSTNSDDSQSNRSGIITVVLESDDIFQYIHDNKRLYT